MCHQQTYSRHHSPRSTSRHVSQPSMPSGRSCSLNCWIDGFVHKRQLILNRIDIVCPVVQPLRHWRNNLSAHVAVQRVGLVLLLIRNAPSTPLARGNIVGRNVDGLDDGCGQPPGRLNSPPLADVGPRQHRTVLYCIALDCAAHAGSVHIPSACGSLQPQLPAAHAQLQSHVRDFATLSKTTQVGMYMKSLCLVLLLS